ERVLRDAAMLGGLLREHGESAAILRQVDQPLRQRDVPLVLELRHRQLAVGAARMAGDEREIAFLGARGRPSEVVPGAGRLAVLPGAEEGDVEVVTGKIEVVGIAARSEERRVGKECRSRRAAE